MTQFTINDVRVLTHNQVLKILNQLEEENKELKSENAKIKKELSLLAEFNQKAIL